MDDEYRPDDENVRDLVPTYERAEVEMLLGVLEKEGRGRWPVLHGCCVILLAVPLGMLSLCAVLGSTVAESLVPLGIAALGIAAIYGFGRLSTTNTQRDAVRRLAMLNDPKSVPALLTAVTWPEASEYRHVIHVALTRLLPRLRASDSAVLTRRHRSILRRNLGLYGWEPEFVVAILKALEQIGDSDDVPAVQALLHRPVRNARQRTIHNAAEACLPALLERRDRSGSSLLRPSEAAMSAPGTLLTPADSTSHTDSSTLLRPEPSDEEMGA